MRPSGVLPSSPVGVRKSPYFGNEKDLFGSMLRQGVSLMDNRIMTINIYIYIYIIYLIIISTVLQVGNVSVISEAYRRLFNLEQKHCNVIMIWIALLINQ